MASARPGSPASTVWSLRVQMIRSPGLAQAPSAIRTAGAVLDDAQADELVADPAGQLPAQRVVGGHQQGVGAGGGQRDVGGCGGVHHLLGLAADDLAVLVIVGQHGGVAVAEAQAGVLFPPVAEPDGFGQADIAESGGEQGQAAAILHGLQLADIPGQDHLGAAVGCVGDQVGQVRAGQHRGLIDHQQRAWADPDRAAGTAPPGQVTQELRAVIGHRNPGGQGVTGRLGRGDADHRAQPGLSPDAGGLGQHPGLPGPGRGVDHGYELAVGQRRPRGGGLVLTQPGLHARRVRVVRVASQRVVELQRVRAEQLRGLRPVQARRAACACLRDHAFFHGQLRARGVPGAAVPLIDAAPISA